MSSRVRARVALVVGLVALLALTPVSDLHADDDDEASGVPFDAARGLGAPSDLVSSSSPAVDPDPMVQAGPSGEHDPRIGVVLAAHPDRDVLICLAGCGVGGPKLVAVRNRPAEILSDTRKESREAIHSSGSLDAPASTDAAGSVQPEIGDVICVAGCVGAPGAIVQHTVRLTWIGRGASEDLKGALRSVADRLVANEVEAQTVAARHGLAHEVPDARQAWVSDHARRLLVEQALPDVLAALVRSASAVADRGRTDQR